MKRSLQPVLASTSLFLLLLLALPTAAGADSNFADIQFADQSNAVTLSLPSSPCRVDRRHVESCQWVLFVNEPKVPGGPVVGMASGTSGALTVPYPSGFCGTLQADALFGTPLRKMVGFRHKISTCGCARSPVWPTVLSGVSPVHPHSAQAIYLAELNNNWTLYVTHPHGSGQVFAGTISTNGAFTNLMPHQLEGADRFSQVAPNQIRFRFVNRGYLDGISFTSTCGNQVTFDATVNGSPALPSQFLLGPSLTPAASSPITFTG